MHQRLKAIVRLVLKLNWILGAVPIASQVRQRAVRVVILAGCVVEIGQIIILLVTHPMRQRAVNCARRWRWCVPFFVRQVH